MRREVHATPGRLQSLVCQQTNMEDRCSTRASTCAESTSSHSTARALRQPLDCGVADTMLSMFAHPAATWRIHAPTRVAVLSDPAFLPPLPQAIHDFARQLMPGKPHGHHGQSTVVCLVCDEITQYRGRRAVSFLHLPSSFALLQKPRNGLFRSFQGLFQFLLPGLRASRKAPE